MINSNFHCIKDKPRLLWTAWSVDQVLFGYGSQIIELGWIKSYKRTYMKLSVNQIHSMNSKFNTQRDSITFGIDCAGLNKRWFHNFTPPE